MSETAQPSFDAAKAHRHFSSACFNHAWTLIERANRTAAEDEAMVLCAHASLWHWMQRPDCTDQSLHIGHWQISRAYALVGQGENALRHAMRSLESAENLPPFFKGYAHEAIARAAWVLGDREKFSHYLDEARTFLQAVMDADEKEGLEKDLTRLAFVAV